MYYRIFISEDIFIEFILMDFDLIFSRVYVFGDGIIRDWG